MNSMNQQSALYVCCMPTGAHLLEKLHSEVEQQGVQMALCNPSEQQQGVQMVSVAAVAAVISALVRIWGGRDQVS